MATKRSDAYAVWFMPETTYGVDPGIVAAAFVDGTSEAYSYIPDGTYKAYARIAGGVEGLPRREMVEAEQVFPTTDSDPFMAKGPRRGGSTFSFDMLMHGGLLDDTTDRPVAPPWAQLATSASGRCVGHRSGDSGGGNGASHASKVGTSPNVNYFPVASLVGTAGTTAAGHVFGVDYSGGSGAPDIHLVRPTHCADTDEFGDVTGTTSGCLYNGTSVGLPSGVSANDPIYWTSQVIFDRRLEDAGSFGSSTAQLSFTMLILRPEQDSIQLIRGVRCTEFEITDENGAIPRIKLSFHFKDFKTFGEDGSTAFGGTPVIDDEPAYYASWPCPKVTTASHVTFLKYADGDEDGAYSSPSVVRDLDLTGFSVKWNAGYNVRHSNMATETVADLRQTTRQTLEVRFMTLYYDDWRDMLGLCSAVDGANTYNTFPFIYWTGEKRSQIWFAAFPSLHLREDPGPGDGDHEGNQAQEIVLGMRPYRADLAANGTDAATFAVTTTPQTRFALGTM